MEPRAPDPDEAIVTDEPAGNDGMEGRYANYFLVGHNALEFVMDFGQMYTGKRERMHSRIVVSPPYAKELLRMLGESIHNYEEEFGEIADIGGRVAPETP
jgi:Protein of unknown function (DUF3467)